ncbi:hypothetical protein B0J14DRAFT_607026 [Halenospora varia]|nr:hypothetical protein B0J14DRAFT_607026 [Halenospora varia]
MASPSRIERDAKATTAPGSSQYKKTVYMPSHMDGTISSSSSISKQKSQTPQATPSNVMSKYDKSRTPTISASKTGPQPSSGSQYTPDSMLPPVPPSDSTYKLSASTTKAKSFLTTRHDQHMASRQTKIKSMREDERKEQEKWAQSYMARIGICPEGFDWKAVDIFGRGYRCDGGHHIMTNDIIAEGQGGVYLWVDPEDSPEDIYGPYYPDEDSPGWVKYCGPEPKDRYAPNKFKTESGSGAPTSGKSIRILAHVESRLKSKTLPTASSMQREASRSEYAGGRSNNTLTQSLHSSRHLGASSIAPPPPPSSSRAGYYTPQGFVSQQPPINSSSRSDEERRARRAESHRRGG